MSVGLFEILLVVLVFVIVGPRRITDLFRSLGRGVHDFVDTLGRDEEHKEIEDGPDEEEPGPRK